MRSHVGAGTGAGHAFGAGGEHASCSEHVVGIELAAFGDHVEREPVDGSRQLGELTHPALAELVVLEAFVEDDADHAGEQRRVLARADLQVDVGERREFGAARIDHDQLHAVGLAAAHHHEWVGALQPADRGVRRHHRVVADRHVDVGVGEALVARLPATEAEPGEALGRLVDGDRGVERHRVDALVERTGRADGDRVLVPTGTGVRGHRPRTVGVDDPTEFGSDLVEGFGARDLLERAVGSATQGSAQTIRVGHLVGELATLDARVALEERVVHDAADGDHPVVGDVDLHRATRVADPAERRLGRDPRTAARRGGSR